MAAATGSGLIVVWSTSSAGAHRPRVNRVCQIETDSAIFDVARRCSGRLRRDDYDEPHLREGRVRRAASRPLPRPILDRREGDGQSGVAADRRCRSVKALVGYL